MNLSDAAKALEMIEQGYFVVPYHDKNHWRVMNLTDLFAELTLAVTEPTDMYPDPITALAAAYDALYEEKKPIYDVLDGTARRTLVHSVVRAASNQVVKFLRMVGVEPYSLQGNDKLGDPADWGEDIDETMCVSIERGGVDLTIRPEERRANVKHES